MKAKKKIGRPPEPVPKDVAQAIVDWIAAGKTLTSYIEANGYPTPATVTRWKQKDQAFAEEFARAREAGAAMMIDEGQDLLDGAGAENIAVMKERAAYRLKRAACFAPHLYGTKVALGGDASAPPIKVEQTGPQPPDGGSLRDWAAKLAAMVTSGEDG